MSAQFVSSPLIYALVAARGTILAECSNAVGNFAIVTRTMVGKISQSLSEDDHQMRSYLYDGYIFHCFQRPEAQLLTMAMTDKSASIHVVFKFLADLANTFLELYGYDMPHRVVPLGYNDSFSAPLKQLMAKYNRLDKHHINNTTTTASSSSFLNLKNDESTHGDEDVQKVKTTIDDIHSVMIQNIGKK